MRRSLNSVLTVVPRAVSVNFAMLLQLPVTSQREKQHAAVSATCRARQSTALTHTTLTSLPPPTHATAARSDLAHRGCGRSLPTRSTTFLSQGSSRSPTFACTAASRHHSRPSTRFASLIELGKYQMRDRSATSSGRTRTRTWA